ncbi:MAG: Tab2/Atab2 family RNA-binding protein [Nostocaceae cyanobacterium]|nr:Tab2/Atab2 family RNA-binding protein [Nostocaceae cyanobacterium]
MRIWQADFYHHGQSWELLICDPTRSFEYTATCPQSQANSTWVATQLQQASSGNLPNVIQVFRPQSLGIIQQAASSLGVSVEPTRRTSTLKKWLQEKQYSIVVDQPPPTPLPENLWGEQWRFATIQAGEITDIFAERPIPILHIPEVILPINLGLASTEPVSGVVIYGGRQSMRLARWLQEVHPVNLNYIAGEPDGLVLEAGLVDRWIIATFVDEEVTASARVYQQRLQQNRGLHFLLVQPDDSGMTYSGFWLLQKED